MRRFTHYFLIIYCVSFAACNSDKEGIHPVSERLPDDSILAFQADFTKDTPVSFLSLPIDGSWRDRFTITDSTLVNDFDGLPPTKMDMDDKGNIYILQGERNRINVYDKEGSYQYSIGQYGRGPGEIEYLYSFDFNEDYSKLYILDFFQVEIYRLVNGRYEPLTAFTHNLIELNTICILDESIYISGFTFVKPGTRNNAENRIESLPIQKFDAEHFEHLSSFGFEYRSFSDIPQFNRFMSKNVLACNKKTNTVVGQMKDIPYMFGYSPEGDVKWISKLSNVVGTEFTETTRPSVIPTNESVFYHFQDFREIYNSKYELIQTELREPFSFSRALARGEILPLPQIDGPDYTTIIVDTETGELFVSHNYGVIGAIRDNKAILFDVDRSATGRENTIYLYEY